MLCKKIMLHVYIFSFSLGLAFQVFSHVLRLTDTHDEPVTFSRVDAFQHLNRARDLSGVVPHTRFMTTGEEQKRVALQEISWETKLFFIAKFEMKTILSRKKESGKMESAV